MMKKQEKDMKNFKIPVTEEMYGDVNVVATWEMYANSLEETEKGKNMKTYKIPVTWEMYGEVEVDANSLEEAIQKYDEKEEYLDLPDEQYYVDGSFGREKHIEIIKDLNRIKE